MAITFKLKYGHPSVGWNYIDLTDLTNRANVDYVMDAPREGLDTQSETGAWRVLGSSLADLISKVETIEDLFERAASYDRQQIGQNQIFLTAQLDASLDTWESQIFSGRVNPPGTLFTGDWANLAHDFEITWERENGWKRLVTVAWTNPNSATNPYVYNNNDGLGSVPTKNINYMDIAAAQVPGDLPAPVNLNFKVRATSGVDRLIILHNYNSLPSTMTYQYEGETGSGDTTDATRSGGKYKDVTVPADTTGTTKEWDALTVLKSHPTSAWIRVLLSAKFSATVKMIPYIDFNGTKYYGSASIITGYGSYFQLIDLGILRYPDIIWVLETLPSWYGVKLGIKMICSAGATVSVDYAQFCLFDNFAVIEFATDVVDVNNIHINILDGRAYNVGVGGAAGVQDVGVMIGGIALQPNTDQRLMLKFTSQGIDTMTDYLEVVTFDCWARKRTL